MEVIITSHPDLSHTVIAKGSTNPSDAFATLVLWSLVLLEEMKKRIYILPVEKQKQSKQDYADILMRYHELLDKAAKF